MFAIAFDLIVAETKPKAEHPVEQRPTQTEKLYTVRPGDSLSRISQNACGGGKRIDISALRRANASVLKADSIQPGMKLSLPCP